MGAASRNGAVAQASLPAWQSGGASAFTGPPLHALAHAYLRGLTGTIVMETESGQIHAIYFVDGAPAKVRTAEPVAPLDTVLLRQGNIDPAQLAGAVAVACVEPDVLLGELLVARGLLHPIELEAALRWQLLEKLSYVMRCSDGSRHRVYNKYDLLAEVGGKKLYPVDPLYTLMHLARLDESRSAVKSYIARLAGSQLRLKPDADTTRYALSSNEHVAVALLAETPRSVEELVSAGVDRESANAVAFVLGVTGALVRAMRESGPVATSIEPPRQSNVRLRDSAPDPLEEQACEEPPTGPTLRAVASVRPSEPALADDPSTGPTMRQQLPTDPTAKRDKQPASHITGHKAYEVPEKGTGCFRGWPAAQAFVEAERALRFLDHERAEAAAEHAVLMDPDKPDYRTLLAFIQAERKGQVPWWSSDAEHHYDPELEVLSRVIGEHPNHEPAYYYRARLLMRLKRFQAAMSDFEMASILNPGNIDAARELRGYENAKRKRRREQAAKKRTSGVMRWLKGDD